MKWYIAIVHVQNISMLMHGVLICSCVLCMFWICIVDLCWFLHVDYLLEYKIELDVVDCIYIIYKSSTVAFIADFVALHLVVTRVLVPPWIYNLPPVCWCTVWKHSSKRQLVRKFGTKENDYCHVFCFYICIFITFFYTYIYIYTYTL